MGRGIIMFEEIIKKIEKYNDIVIVRHIGVDPDALCSQLALRDVIRLNYPKKNVYAIGKGSTKFTAIGKLDKIQKIDNALLIVCDVPDMQRIDSAKVHDYAESIKIDHHPFVEKFCDIEWIDEEKTSTCEMIMQLIKDTKLECNSDIAALLYMGLVSDSNRFLFQNCSPKTFEFVSYYLKKYPFSLTECYQKLYFRPLTEVRLEGYISSNMQVSQNGCGYIVVTNETTKQLGVDSAAAANMINHYNYIKELLVWATVSEDKKNHQVRVSIRSRGPEVNKVAEKHHGGGHKYAAGVKTKTLDEALEIVKDLDEACAAYLKKISEGKENDH